MSNIFRVPVLCLLILISVAIPAFAEVAGLKVFSLLPDREWPGVFKSPGFTAGNFVVCRVEAGGGSVNNTAVPVYLDEYSPAGDLVSTVALPTVSNGANWPLTLTRRSSNNECQITRSVDGRYLIVAGYGAPPGTANVGTISVSGVPRVIGRIDANGTIDTSTGIRNFNSEMIRGAASDDGSRFWATVYRVGLVLIPFGADDEGVVVSNNITDNRSVDISSGQLYVSTAFVGSNKINRVGTGLPTTNNSTMANLPGFPTNGFPNQYYFADLDTSVPGPDTLYVADEGSDIGAAGGGVKKFSLVSGLWQYNGTFPNLETQVTASNFFGLTGVSSGQTVTLFATKSVSSTLNSATQIVSFVDSTGYNSTPTALPTLIKSSPANTLYRGVAMAPVSAMSPGELAFDSVNYKAAEGTGSAELTIARTYGSDGAVSVDYSFDVSTRSPKASLFGAAATGGPSCDSNGVDYLNVSGTVQFAAGEHSKTIFVPICDDSLFEGTESFNISLVNPIGGATLGSLNAATVTINDDDPQPVPAAIEFGAQSQIEDESQTMQVLVIRTGDLSGISSVSFSTTGATADSGTVCTSISDFVQTSGTLVFQALETSKVIGVPLCSDSLKEASEKFGITLSNPTNAVLGTQNAFEGWINDTASTYANSAPILIAPSGPAAPYPSQLTITNGPQSIGYVRVTLFDVQHAPADDLDFLLVGPGGQRFVLMADAGGQGGLASPATLTFNDHAAEHAPDNAVLTTGQYRPTNWLSTASSFPNVPSGPHYEPGPGGDPAGTAKMNTVFGGTNSNGVWSLYVHAAGASGFVGGGAIAGGWGLELVAPSAADAGLCGRIVSAAGHGIRNAKVSVLGASGTLAVTTGGFGYYCFENLPAGQSYVVSVKAKRHSFAQPIRLVELNDSVVNVDFVAEQ